MSPLQAQSPPPFSFAENGKITLQPEGSDWVFAASLPLRPVEQLKMSITRPTGRIRNISEQRSEATGTSEAVEDFADSQVQHQQSHAVVDFTVGRDVGLSHDRATTVRPF